MHDIFKPAFFFVFDSAKPTRYQKSTGTEHRRDDQSQKSGMHIKNSYDAGQNRRPRNDRNRNDNPSDEFAHGYPDNTVRQVDPHPHTTHNTL